MPSIVARGAGLETVSASQVGSRKPLASPEERCVILLGLCLSVLLETPSEPDALLVHGGRILVGDARGNVATAVLAEGPRIVAIGSLQSVSEHPAAARARRLDLAGAVALPGLQDAHVDLQAMTEGRASEDFSGVRSAEELLERLAALCAERADGRWILARGLDPSSWPNPRWVSAGELSSRCPFHPLLIELRGGDAALANQRALELAGLDGPLNPPPRIVGGRVVLGDNGHASGLLIGAARELVRARIAPPLMSLWESQYPLVEEQLLARGLVCVHDLGTQQEFLRFLERRRAAGLLRLRVVAYPSLGLDPLAVEVGPRRTDAPLDLLSMPGVHLALDAGLGFRNAALLEPYADSAGDSLEERGVLLIEEERLAGRLMDATRQGLEVCIEAHGDRAVRTALDAWERLSAGLPQTRSARLRMQGLDLVAPRDWPRVSQLTLAVGLEPARVWLEPQVRALGPRRSEEQAGWRALASQQKLLQLGSGAGEANGSDPRRVLFAARSAAPKGLALSGAQALQAMTRAPSELAGEAARRGTLEVGRMLDLTVLSGDPTRVEPARLLELEVRATVINARVEFSRR
jgi:predicted amidohydrolase YtcJ